MAPEVMVPWDLATNTLGGDGALPMCWVCAHLIAVHEHELGADVESCGCPRSAILPADVIARRDAVRDLTAPAEQQPAPAAPTYTTQTRDAETGATLVQRFARTGPNTVRTVGVEVVTDKRRTGNNAQQRTRAARAARGAALRR